MESHYWLQVEQLTDEIKSLFGCGAFPKHLTSPSRPILRSLFATEDLSIAGAGNEMRRQLEYRVGTLKGHHPIGDVTVPDVVVIPALMISLALTMSHDYAFKRRPAAVRTIGYCGSVEAWRRAFGPERDLARILAIHLLDLHQAKQDRAMATDPYQVATTM